MSDTPPLLEQLEKLQKEATPAPWDMDAATQSGIYSYLYAGESNTALLGPEQNGRINTEDAHLIVTLVNNLPQILQALRVQEAAQHPLMPKAIAHHPLCDEVILLPTDNVACDCGARIINAVLDNFHAALQSNQEGG